MKRCTFALLMALGIHLGSADLQAEVFVLAHGGRIEGAWLNRGDAAPDMYQIEMFPGGRITVPASLVEDVVVKSAVVQRYEELLPTVPNTVEGHLEMADRCRKADLTTQRDFHLRKVLELDPNHAEARHALGFSQMDGEWIKADEWFKSQGFVRYKGGWRLAQEVDLEARNERQVIEEKEWRKRLKVWRSSIVRGRNDAAEALAQLKAIDSALAIAGLRELLADPEEPNQLKLLYIDVLAKFNHSTAVAALLERVMKDPDLEIRERSIDATKNHGGVLAVTVLSRALKDKNNDVVNQAAWALGRLGDPTAIGALIEAVVTKHRFKVQTGSGPGGISGNFSPQGGGGLQAGGSVKLIEKEFQNRQVLTALTTLVPAGVNFGYDKQAWKDWYAQQQISPGTNLRRDM
ncbi:MAG: HEAT repeat domain-containing protein [Pirellulaceae bacterium]